MLLKVNIILSNKVISRENLSPFKHNNQSKQPPDLIIKSRFSQNFHNFPSIQQKETSGASGENQKKI